MNRTIISVQILICLLLGGLVQQAHGLLLRRPTETRQLDPGALAKRAPFSRLERPPLRALEPKKSWAQKIRTFGKKQAKPEQSGKFVRLAQKISKKGGKALGYLKDAAHPIRSANKYFNKLIEKYLYGKVEEKIDEAEAQFLEESGIKDDPKMWESMKPTYELVKQQYLPQIKGQVTGFIDKKLRAVMHTAHTRFIIPTLSQVYDVPQKDLSYVEYLRRKGTIEVPSIDKIIELTKEGVKTRYPEEKPDQANEKFNKELAKQTQLVHKKFADIYTPLFKHVGLSIEKISPKNTKEVVDSITPHLQTIANNPTTGEAAQSAANELMGVVKSFNEKHGATTAPKKITSKQDIGTLQRLIAASEQSVLAHYSNLEYSDFVAYTTHLKDTLLPKILLKHFAGRTIPGTNTIIEEQNIDEAIKKILEMQDKIERGIKIAESVYKAFNKTYKIYQLTISLTDSIATTIELAQMRESDKYYTRTFDAINTYVDAFDRLLGILEIDTVDLQIDERIYAALPMDLIPAILRPDMHGLKPTTKQTHYTLLGVEPMANKEEIENAFENKSAEAPRALQKKLKNAHDILKSDKKRKVYDAKLKLAKNLGILRYFAQQYKKFNNYFLRLFVAELDETGEKIFKLKPERALELAIEVSKDNAKELLKRALIKILSRQFGTVMGTTLAGTVIGVFTQIREGMDEETFQQEEYLRAQRERYGALEPVALR